MSVTKINPMHTKSFGINFSLVYLSILISSCIPPDQITQHMSLDSEQQTHHSPLIHSNACESSVPVALSGMRYKTGQRLSTPACSCDMSLAYPYTMQSSTKVGEMQQVPVTFIILCGHDCNKVICRWSKCICGVSDQRWKLEPTGLTMTKEILQAWHLHNMPETWSQQHKFSLLHIYFIPHSSVRAAAASHTMPLTVVNSIGNHRPYGSIRVLLGKVWCCQMHRCMVALMHLQCKPTSIKLQSL